MRTLLLVRHAKSSWDDPALADKLRPLNDRGLHDAPQMGKRLAKQGIAPDLILSSPAERALKTAQLIAEKVGYSPADIAIDDRLYDTTSGVLLSVIQGLDAKVHSAMLVGHNPMMLELVERLTSGQVNSMPTCSVVELTYDAESWSTIGTAKPTDITVDAPKHKT
jgi:phosphohistidine phosphatase